MPDKKPSGKKQPDKKPSVRQRLINRETVLYLVFGGLTTLINIYLFKVIEQRGLMPPPVNNLVCTIVAVTFAFVTNKPLVFGSKSWSWKTLRREIPSFYGARAFTFLLEEAGITVAAYALHLDDILLFDTGIEFIDTITGLTASKFVLTVIVVILNFFFSKYFIFKTKEG